MVYVLTFIFRFNVCLINFNLSEKIKRYDLTALSISQDTFHMKGYHHLWERRLNISSELALELVHKTWLFIPTMVKKTPSKLATPEA